MLLQRPRGQTIRVSREAVLASPGAAPILIGLDDGTGVASAHLHAHLTTIAYNLTRTLNILQPA